MDTFNKFIHLIGTHLFDLKSRVRQFTSLNTESRAFKALEDLVLFNFFSAEIGNAYGIDTATKKSLLSRIRDVCTKVPSGTSWIYHLVLVTEILKLPPVEELPGDIIECGCWKGASSVSLSLACGLVGRRLIVCDTFAGLPKSECNVVRNYPHIEVFGYYQEGMYEGKLVEVKQNINQFGNLAACDFKVGLFSETLKHLDKCVAFAFLDVDLTSSMRDCIRYIWPFLVDGGCIYTDDSCDMEVVRVWFDDAWWIDTLGERAPGYVGSGCGLPISPSFSSLGYAKKISAIDEKYHRVPWLHYK